MSRLARGKTRTELTQGLPSRILLRIDWSAACDLTADRRNCVIHRALLHKDQITRPTVGVDKITFIWRGDARIEVVPDAYLLRTILLNDEAVQGLREWPTDEQQLYLSLEHIKVYDLRPARVQRRESRTPEGLAAEAERRRQYNQEHPEARRKAVQAHRARAKAARTKAERGRFVLS